MSQIVPGNGLMEGVSTCSFQTFRRLETKLTEVLGVLLPFWMRKQRMCPVGGHAPMLSRYPQKDDDDDDNDNDDDDLSVIIKIRSRSKAMARRTYATPTTIPWITN